jgi:hypothetical protein
MLAILLLSACSRPSAGVLGRDCALADAARSGTACAFSNESGSGETHIRVSFQGSPRPDAIEALPRTEDLKAPERASVRLAFYTGIQAALAILLLVAGHFWGSWPFRWLAWTAIASFFLQWATIGFADSLFPGNPGFWGRRALFLFMGGAIVFSLRYVSSFLESSLNSPWVKRAERVFGSVALVLCVSAFVWQNDAVRIAASLLLAVSPVYLACLGILAVIRGQKEGLWYLVAHSVGSIALPFHVLSILGFLDLPLDALHQIASLGTIQGLSLHGFLVFRRIRAELLEKRRAEQIELLVKKAQLSPHFFANALNTVSALVHARAHDADELLSKMAEFHRTLAEIVDQTWIPLTTELELVVSYVEIETRRFGAKGTYVVTAPGEDLLRTILVPPLILQTLVENAFKHGVSKRTSATRVSVTVECSQGDSLSISCVNDSPLSGEHDVPERKGAQIAGASGMGLENLRRRLDILYGVSARLDVHSGSEKFQVDVSLPLAFRGDSIPTAAVKEWPRRVGHISP